MKKWILRILAAVVIILALGYIIGTVNQNAADKERASTNRETYYSMCAPGDYTAVARYPDQYKGKLIYVAGTVVQVLEAGKNVTLRLQEDKGTWYATYRYLDGEAHILENDRITIYGECTGTTTYKTVSGTTMTVPSVSGYLKK